MAGQRRPGIPVLLYINKKNGNRCGLGKFTDTIDEMGPLCNTNTWRLANIIAGYFVAIAQKGNFVWWIKKVKDMFLYFYRNSVEPSAKDRNSSQAPLFTRALLPA